MNFMNGTLNIFLMSALLLMSPLTLALPAFDGRSECVELFSSDIDLKVIKIQHQLKEIIKPLDDLLGDLKKPPKTSLAINVEYPKLARFFDSTMLTIIEGNIHSQKILNMQERVNERLAQLLDPEGNRRKIPTENTRVSSDFKAQLEAIDTNPDLIVKNGKWDGQKFHVIMGRNINPKNIQMYKISHNPDYVLAHEYGHGVYDQNATLPALAPPSTNSIFSKIPPDTIKELQKKVIPYTELFADTLAVIYADDPKAMECRGDNCTYRDFSSRLSPKDISNNIVDPHNQLDAVRSYIWYNLLTGPKKVAPSEVLSILLRACDQEVLFRVTHPEYFEMDNQTMNKRLIEILEG